MTVMSRLLSAWMHLGRPETRRVNVDRNLEVPMPDGVVLRADRWYPDDGAAATLPVLLVRTPYGRRQLGIIFRMLAERGYQVVAVSCRGTFGSGGEWDPFHHEQADGQAVLQWLSNQPWGGGPVGLWGASYMGLTQWSVLPDPPESVRAVALGVTNSHFAEIFYPGGSFALASSLVWIHGLAHQEEPLWRRLRSVRDLHRTLAAASATMPLGEADVAMTGRSTKYFQDWLEHDRVEDPWWSPLHFGLDVGRVPPAALVAGWYDVFLPYQVADFEALRASGRDAELVIGPWTHGTPSGAAHIVRETLSWMDRHLRSRSSTHVPARVRLFVMGAGRWVGYEEWPPPATSTSWYLAPNGVLAEDVPGDAAPDRYRFDPSDPTPSVGGASLHAKNAGPKENRALEARSDVLTYTTSPFAADVTVAGPVAATLFVRSSCQHTDFFVRLCDVSPDGKSRNLTDGILRLPSHAASRAEDGTLAIEIEMFPTAVTIARGHRIRLQVSSGAHPLYTRNPGTGDPLGKSTSFQIADQEIFHDPEHPSRIALPILATPIPAAGGRRGWGSGTRAP